MRQGYLTLKADVDPLVRNVVTLLDATENIYNGTFCLMEQKRHLRPGDIRMVIEKSDIHVPDKQRIRISHVSYGSLEVLFYGVSGYLGFVAVVYSIHCVINNFLKPLTELRKTYFEAEQYKATARKANAEAAKIEWETNRDKRDWALKKLETMRSLPTRTQIDIVQEVAPVLKVDVAPICEFLKQERKIRKRHHGVSEEEFRAAIGVIFEELKRLKDILIVDIQVRGD